MSHVLEHCDTPKITRSWKALGCGAMWACSCGKQYRLTWASSYADNGYVWQWNALKSGLSSCVRCGNWVCGGDGRRCQVEAEL